MKIGDQIRTARVRLKISRADLKDRLELKSEQSVMYWENGRNYPSTKTARKLEQVLGIKLDWSEQETTDLLRAAVPTASKEDIELMEVLLQLPPESRRLMGEMARALATAKPGTPAA